MKKSLNMVIFLMKKIYLLVIIFLALALPTNATNDKDHCDLPTAVKITPHRDWMERADTWQQRLVGFGEHINWPLIESITKVAAFATFFIALNYYIITNEWERNTFDSSKTFHDVLVGMRKYNWCDGMHLHPLHDFRLLAFSCFLTANIGLSHQIKNTWGNSSVYTVFDQRPFDRALHSLATNEIYSLVYTDSQGNIKSVRTTRKNTFCEKRNCVRVIFNKGKLPLLREPSSFHKTLWDTSNNQNSPTSRSLLQVAHNVPPLMVLEDEVAKDNLMQETLVDVYKIFHAHQCPDIRRLGDHLQDLYDSIFAHTPQNLPNVALHLWYNLTKGRVILAQVKAQFANEIIQGNSTCDFHSNQTLVNASDARVTFAYNGWTHLLVSKRLQDMFALTLTQDLTITHQILTTPSQTLSREKTFTPSYNHQTKSLSSTDSRQESRSPTAKQPRQRWIYWGQSNAINAAKIDKDGLPIMSTKRTLSGVSVQTGRGMHIDPEHNKIYFTDSNVIYVGDVNATNPEIVSNASTLLTSTENVYGVFVYNKIIYFGSATSPKIGLINPARPSTPNNITDTTFPFLYMYIDPAQRAYFSTSNGSAFVADIDPKNPTRILNSASLNLGSMNVDEIIPSDAEGFYWRDQSNVGKVWYKLFNASSSNVIIQGDNGCCDCPALFGSQAKFPLCSKWMFASGCSVECVGSAAAYGCTGGKSGSCCTACPSTPPWPIWALYLT